MTAVTVAFMKNDAASIETSPSEKKAKTPWYGWLIAALLAVLVAGTCGIAFTAVALKYSWLTATVGAVALLALLGGGVAAGAVLNAQYAKMSDKTLARIGRVRVAGFALLIAESVAAGSFWSDAYSERLWVRAVFALGAASLFILPSPDSELRRRSAAKAQ